MTSPKNNEINMNLGHDTKGRDTKIVPTGEAEERTPAPSQALIPFNYLKVWRAHISRLALYLSIFPANFEVSVMSTSLVAITDDLQGFNRIFILIWSKLCDLYSQKLVQSIALILFVAFSAACGAAQTITQLIVLRAFQGVGGVGLYAVPTIMCFELSPPQQRAKYMGLLIENGKQVTSKNTKISQRPVLPWQLLSDRVFFDMLSNSFTVGTVYTTSIIQILQRVQTLAGLSSLQARYRLLPLVLASPLGSLTASLIHKRTKFDSVIVLLAAAALQVVWSSLLSILPVNTDVSAEIIPPAQYGYELILGFGLGTSISTLFLTVQPNIERRYITVALSAINQWRSLGGAIGLAVVTSVTAKSINSNLAEYLSSEQIYRVLQSAAAIQELPTSLQGVTRSEFGRAYNEQIKIVMGLAIAQLLVTLLMWKKKKATE